MIIHLLYTRTANLRVRGTPKRVLPALDLGMKRELIPPYFKNKLHRPTNPDGDFMYCPFF